MFEFQAWLADHAVRVGILLLVLAAVVAILLRPVRRRPSARHRPFRPRTRTLMLLVSRRQRKLTHRPDEREST